MATYYLEHSRELRRNLGAELPTEELRRLHRRQPWKHAAAAGGLVGALALGLAGAIVLEPWWLWIPCAVVAGFAVFNFTVLLHEVVHHTVLQEQSAPVQRALGLLYAIPSGISASQFTRWHLDHHAGLGSPEEDPKRHWLSPKINARWLKLLYFTPALFFIYFRAARRETSTYPAELQKKIAGERRVAMLFHLTILAAIWIFAGFDVALRAYIVPIFLVFPVAFALNRLGQHYDIDPSDPAKWATFVRGSWFWDIAYLCSNYHLEHHYFPSVPLYNLPRLQKLLLPFYEKRGMTPRGYGQLVWGYIVLNRKPHTNWEESGVTSPAPTEVAGSS
ncbi:MAG TPA: fatty acid desaturase [Thermoanaerobaculia bacterium]|nr:fatty acid desaturase [Thermoanaerobaculia bacterium]